jgi:steroid 5-alpha reductase family enzyme
MLWFGLYISASTVFRGWQYLAVLSPVFVHTLITKLSGIPILEISADKKWGHLKEYQEYKNKTPILVPFIQFLGIA